MSFLLDGDVAAGQDRRPEAKKRFVRATSCRALLADGLGSRCCVAAWVLIAAAARADTVVARCRVDPVSRPNQRRRIGSYPSMSRLSSTPKGPGTAVVEVAACCRRAFRCETGVVLRWPRWCALTLCEAAVGGSFVGRSSMEKDQKPDATDAVVVAGSTLFTKGARAGHGSGSRTDA